MHEAIRAMLRRYECQTLDDHVNALREILQELALLGLWRGKFFEHAAFYGGTALRVLHGMDRYSEDLDFSLLRTTPDFSIGVYGDALRREIGSFGFEVEFDRRAKAPAAAIESAFLKTNTLRELLRIEVKEALGGELHPGAQLKIKIEVDKYPPEGFATESRYILHPISFPVRAYCLPDLFAGKMHAVLCRQWGKRVKGRDWYDLVWFAGRYPHLNIDHLERRMRQSGHYDKMEPLDLDAVKAMLKTAIKRLDIDQVRAEVAPYVRDRRALEVWSHEFFGDVIGRLVSTDS